MIQVKINTDALQRTIRALLDLRQRGGDGLFRPVYQAAAKAIEAQVVRSFNANAAPGGAFIPISPITVIMRIRKGRKVSSMAEAERLALTLRPLDDTGILRKSLRAAAPSHVSMIQGHRVSVGTSVNYASVHQRGERVTWRFGASEEKRFNKNFRKVLPGSKPKITTTGRYSKAKKNWNREYFILLGSFRRWAEEGRTFRVPVRRVVPEAESELRPLEEKLRRVVDRGIASILAREAGGRG